ncbi:MAG: uroporphyrinogen-III synthase [Sphingobacteriales bacterium]|jgi:uroporphyrinogen-III synthase
MSFKVLITRKEEPDSVLSLGASVNDFFLIGVPFIETKSRFFKSPAVNPSWVLFTSKNGVKSFFDNGGGENLPEGVKWAVSASGTGKTLELYGISPDFCPNYSDTDQMLEEWLSLIQPQEVVWYPCASKTIGKVEHQLKKKVRLFTFPVYTTTAKPKLISGDMDLLIFTSPSNVKSYLQLNEVPPQSALLAMGKSTSVELKRQGLNHNLASGYSSQDLLNDILTMKR